MKQSASLLALLCLVLTLAISSVHACAWDSDTLAMEAKGLPDLPYIITGRFERNPPLYYEMRLKRVTEGIARNPADLNLYDDAGVACDRLGRGDEAIAWMAKKNTQLDRLKPDEPAVKDHRYRYYANLGTFLVHRWLRGGKDPKRNVEVKAARDAIAKAIEINPNAHFGRERYQLYAIEWLMDPQKPFFEYLREKLMLITGEKNGPNNVAAPSQAGYQQPCRDAAKGLLGLVALGNAWESADIFSAAGNCLGICRESAIAVLADLRVRELIDAGKKSQWKTPLTGKELIAGLRAVPQIRMVYGEADIEKRYTALRANAEKWHAHRTAFMEERLKAGKHPDTDTDFWDGYKEIPPERVDYGFPRELMVPHPYLSLVLVGLFTLAGIGVAFYWLARLVKSQIQRQADN